MSLAMLALVQGITEFLPISSSAHLILLPKALGAEDQGALIDVALHVGTLFAVMLYFLKDSLRLFTGVGHILTGRVRTEPARLVWLLAIATIPVVILGLILSLTDSVDALRSTALIGWTMIGFGVLLWLADRMPGTARDWGLRDAVVMGLMQALALLPGTSRSGITMTAARFLGFERREAARLSLLMSIPTIIASGVLLGGQAVLQSDWAGLGQAGLAALLAFIAAYLAIAAMMRLLTRFSFTPFVIYRIGLGAVLLWVAYG